MGGWVVAIPQPPGDGMGYAGVISGSRPSIEAIDAHRHVSLRLQPRAHHVERFGENSGDCAGEEADERVLVGGERPPAGKQRGGGAQLLERGELRKRVCRHRGAAARLSRHEAVGGFEGSSPCVLTAHVEHARRAKPDVERADAAAVQRGAHGVRR